MIGPLFTTALIDVVQPANVYDNEYVPTPILGSKSFPVTPVPDQVPPAGVPIKVVAGSPGQNDPRALAERDNTNTSKNIEAPGHPAALDSVTWIALGYNPATPPQLTVIVFVPCPPVIVLPPPVEAQL